MPASGPEIKAHAEKLDSVEKRGRQYLRDLEQRFNQGLYAAKHYYEAATHEEGRSDKRHDALKESVRWLNDIRRLTNQLTEPEEG